MMPMFELRPEPDGSAMLRIDRAGKPVNTLSAAALDELEALFDRLLGLRGLILLSGKPDGFIAGGDLEEFARLTRAEASALSRRSGELLDRFAALPYPKVAAIHGAALGGGLEIALACDWRVASDAPSTRLGLPELKVGLLPAAGGCQRLPRLIGLRPTLDLILASKVLPPARALRVGLVDDVVPHAQLEAVARSRLASGRRRLPRRTGDRLLAPLLIALARRAVVAKTHGLYPAPLAALDAIATGLARGHAAGSAVEAERFGELAESAPARALINLFFDVGAAKKAAATAAAAQSATVIGAGFMGSGVALALARAGCTTRIRDVSPLAVGRALAFARSHLDERVRRRSETRVEAEAILARLSGGTDDRGLARAELVIEAVFEELTIKRQVLAAVECAAGPATIFASNTSAIPIAQIAEGARRPENVVGMHFFSPVHRMPLLEVIRTPVSSAIAVERAVATGIALGKTVIVVRDGPGFYTSRVLSPYLVEAAHVLIEGAAIADVDRAAQAVGFPVGPLTLLDEVGLDVARHAAGVVATAFGERLRMPAPLAEVIASGDLGRKTGRGFYLYGRGRKRPNPAVAGRFPASRTVPSGAEIGERLLLAMTLEAFRAFGDGVLEDCRDGDLGAVLGIGYPPLLGGPFRYADRVGADVLVRRSRELEQNRGIRFAPPEILVAAAANGHRFR